jgi:hypothetical protein
VVAEPPGPNCPAGGEKIEIGIETDAGFEVQQTAYVCNGTNADAGSDVGMDAGSDVGVDAGSDDGGVLDFTCLGAPLPTTAPASISVSGTTTLSVVSSGVVYTTSVPASITARTTTGISLVMATTDGSGVFSLTVPTGGTPFSGVFQASPQGSPTTTIAWPAEPLAADTSDLFVPLVSPTLIADLAQMAVGSFDSLDGVVWVRVEDCGGHPVPNANVAVAGGWVVYLANGQPSKLIATDSSGEAIAFNVPPGDVLVSASVGGNSLRSHTVTASAQVVTATSMRP